MQVSGARFVGKSAPSKSLPIRSVKCLIAFNRRWCAFPRRAITGRTGKRETRVSWVARAGGPGGWNTRDR